MAKIVFCEDEKLLQKLFRVLLRSTEHEVYIASDGFEGLALIERERPDLIMTDISMPNCDGLQLADAIKAHPDLADIPVVFVTGFAQKRDVEEAARHGPVGYLLKPFTAADLREAITKGLAHRKKCNMGGESDESTLIREKH